MRRWWALVLLVLFTCSGFASQWALAQEELTSDQLRRMYDDAVAQLKTAQDRRNELARENEKLKTRIAGLEKELEQARASYAELQTNTLADQQLAVGIRDFMQDHPVIGFRWQLYKGRNLLARGNSDLRSLLDPDWPFPPNR